MYYLCIDLVSYLHTVTNKYHQSFKERDLMSRLYKEMESNEERRKLNMLCLHGYNTSKEVFEFQFTKFKKAFEHVMDFHIL